MVITDRKQKEWYADAVPARGQVTVGSSRIAIAARSTGLAGAVTRLNLEATGLRTLAYLGPKGEVLPHCAVYIIPEISVHSPAFALTCMSQAK